MNDWAKRVEADVRRMVAAGLAYLDAGGTDERELSEAIWGGCDEASGAVHTIARNEVRRLRRR